MKILNCGSLNIDRVFRVRDLVRPGETLAARDMSLGAGGKGLNQSLALARAGAAVVHAGAVGVDGIFLREILEKDSVNTEFVTVMPDVPSGQALIQVTDAGENAIVLWGGANRALRESTLRRALDFMEPGDLLLLQNETSCVAEMIRLGAERNLRVVFNPAPMTEAVQNYPLELVDLLILNTVEAAALTRRTAPDAALRVLRERLPDADIVLTMGGAGSLWCGRDGRLERGAIRTLGPVVDTTAAGDTFIGYFLAAQMCRKEVPAALAEAATAAGWCVTRAGAAAAIPYRNEIAAFLQKDAEFYQSTFGKGNGK